MTNRDTPQLRWTALVVITTTVFFLSNILKEDNNGNGGTVKDRRVDGETGREVEL